MKLKFNHHIKEKNTPQIYDKLYPPDLLTVTAVAVNRKLTKASFSWLSSSFHLLWFQEDRRLGTGEAKHSAMERPKHCLSTKLGSNFTQQCKATQQNGNPNIRRIQTRIIKMYDFRFEHHSVETTLKQYSH